MIFPGENIKDYTMIQNKSDLRENLLDCLIYLDLKDTDIVWEFVDDFTDKRGMHAHKSLLNDNICVRFYIPEVGSYLRRIASDWYIKSTPTFKTKDYNTYILPIIQRVFNFDIKIKHYIIRVDRNNTRFEKLSAFALNAKGELSKDVIGPNHGISDVVFFLGG